MLVKTVINIGDCQLAFLIDDDAGGFIPEGVMLHQPEGVTVNLHMIDGMPGPDMTGDRQTGGVHIYLEVLLLLCFLLLLLFGNHGDCDNSVSELGKLLR